MNFQHFLNVGEVYMKIFQRVDDVKSDFCTFPRSFEKYRWYKPILVAVLTFIFYFILSILCDVLFGIFFPELFSSSLLYNPNSSPGLETVEGIYTSINIAIIIPSFFISSMVVRDRPFSSYLSSRGGWNWEIFVKSSVIALIAYGIITLVEFLIFGVEFDNKFTILTLLAMIIVTLFQSFAEELMCRGFLMQTLGSWFRIPVVAIILQALFFTVIHSYNIMGLVDVLFSGLCYGVIAWYCDGLEVSSALHSVHNIIVFLTAGLTATELSNNITFEGSLEGILISLAAIAAIFLIDRKYNWIGLKRDNSVSE